MPVITYITALSIILPLTLPLPFLRVISVLFLGVLFCFLAHLFWVWKVNFPSHVEDSPFGLEIQQVESVKEILDSQVHHPVVPSVEPQNSFVEPPWSIGVLARVAEVLW